MCYEVLHMMVGLFYPKDIIPGVMRFMQMQRCRPKPCCRVLFRVERLSVINFNMLTEARSV